VTAISGFNCVDGVVISAETEETYADNKVYTHKLFPVLNPRWKVGIAGAGLGYLIDYAKDKILAALHAGITNNQDFNNSLISILDRLYGKEFKRFPVASPSDLRIQLLVNVQFPKENTNPQMWAEPALFECQSNLVTKVNLGKCRILGTGELLKEMAEQFANWNLDVLLAEWASIYVIHEAKRRFGGVGGRTHTFSLMQDGKHRDRMRMDIMRTEMILEIWARVNQLLVLSLSPTLTEDKAKDFIDATRKWLINARHYLQKVERESGKTKYGSVVIGSREMKKFIRKLASPLPKSGRTSF
jgi:hypothetical protein